MKYTPCLKVILKELNLRIPFLIIILQCVVCTRHTATCTRLHYYTCYIAARGHNEDALADSLAHSIMAIFCLPQTQNWPEKLSVDGLKYS